MIFLIQVGVLRNTPIPYIVVINFAEAAFRPKPKNYSVHFYIDLSYPVQFQTDRNEPLALPTMWPCWAWSLITE